MTKLLGLFLVLLSVFLGLLLVVLSELSKWRIQ